MEKHKQKTGYGQQRRNRIEGHPKWIWLSTQFFAERYQADGLQQKLKDDASDDECGD